MALCAFALWSANMGTKSMGTAWKSASCTLMMPPWVMNARVLGWPRTSC